MSESLFARRWQARLERDAEGAPTLSPFFVIEQGADVHLVDLRDPGEAVGVLGHIPGSVFRDPAGLPPDVPVVLVDRDGQDAARMALALERAGRTHVAAMAGGLSAWRRLGLGTSRGPIQPLEPRRTRERQGLLSMEEMREHLGDPRSVRWVKLALLVSSWHVSCIDGRDERGVIGTPGGDAGEFLLMMAAIEKVTGRSLDEEAVASALLAHLDAFGTFYMHTDAHAVQHLLEVGRTDERLRGELGDLRTSEEVLAFLSHPPEAVREALLEHLVAPAHIGCGHIRLMLQHGEDYEIREHLVVAFLRAAYQLWWEGAPELILTILPGEHEEVAVANIHIEGETSGLSAIPLVSPACHGSQLFVNHPGVASYLRRTVVQFHVRGHGPLEIDASREAELQDVVDALATKQLTTTVGHLASGLPIYEITFHGHGEFEVHTQ